MCYLLQAHLRYVLTLKKMPKYVGIWVCMYIKKVCTVNSKYVGNYMCILNSCHPKNLVQSSYISDWQNSLPVSWSYPCHLGPYFLWKKTFTSFFGFCVFSFSVSFRFLLSESDSTFNFESDFDSDFTNPISNPFLYPHNGCSFWAFIWQATPSRGVSYYHL